MNHISRIGKISDVLCSVAVTGKKDRKLVFPAALKDLHAVCSGIPAVSVRRKRSLVDLQDHAVLLGMADDGILVGGELWVITVPENFYMRIFHYIQIGPGVFFF